MKKTMMRNIWTGIHIPEIQVKSKHIIQAIFMGVFIALALSAPFLHFNYKKLKDWEPHVNHSKVYDGIIKQNNNEKNILFDKLEKGTLSNTEFISAINVLDLKKQTEIAAFHKKRNALKKEYSYLGYSSYRYFLYAIGLPVFALFISLLLLVFIFNPAHVKDLKYFYLIGVFACIYVACFWVSHTFLTRTDFPKWTYSGSVNLIALTSTALLFVLIRFFSSRHNKLKILINWILEIRNNHFQRVALRAMEVDEDETIADIIDFENRTQEELSKVVK